MKYRAVLFIMIIITTLSLSGLHNICNRRYPDFLSLNPSQILISVSSPFKGKIPVTDTGGWVKQGLDGKLSLRTYSWEN